MKLSLLLSGLALCVSTAAAIAGDIPNLVGTWVGENETISDKKGLRTWKKTIHITEQTDRRFRGHFTYTGGTKKFFGVVYPDNVSFTWVASDSKGYNHGRILGPDRIAACYVESWEEATVGCSDVTRKSKEPLVKKAPE
ncbi:MAG: hypothetical protein RIC14_00270 [Filomicrobium sp.]